MMLLSETNAYSNAVRYFCDFFSSNSVREFRLGINRKDEIEKEKLIQS